MGRERRGISADVGVVAALPLNPQCISRGDDIIFLTQFFLVDFFSGTQKVGVFVFQLCKQFFLLK